MIRASHGVWLAAIVGLVSPASIAAVAADDSVPAITDWQHADCAGCHAEIEAEWRKTLHAHAWSDPIVQAELARTKAPSCRECHAPASAAAASRGIDCATCHVRDGVILAAAPSLRGALAHPVRAEPALDTVDACRGCHQFAFADDGVHDPNEALQDTVAEWQRSTPFADGRMCQACHMPAVRGDDGVSRTSHRLRGIDDPTLLADAVLVRADAIRRPDGIVVAVAVEVVGNRIGHAFPTGDVFREAILTVRTDGGASDAIVLRRWLARTIDADGAGHHVRTVDDTRVPPPGTGTMRDEVLLADPSATHVQWELRLHRLSSDAARTRGLHEHVEGIAVAHGDVVVHDSH